MASKMPEEKTKLITEQENQMKTRRNKFHCCLKGAGKNRALRNRQGRQREIPPTVTEISVGETWVLQIHIDFFIALLFDCARTKLRIRRVETRQTLISVIGSGKGPSPPQKTRKTSCQRQQQSGNTYQRQIETCT